MTRLLVALALLGALSSPVSAEPDATAADAGALAAAPEEGSASPSAAVTPEAPSVAELLEQAAELKAEVDAYRAEEEAGPRRLALFGAIAAAFLLVVSMLRKFGTLTDRGKRWIPLAAAVLGVGLAVTQALAGGSSWSDAALVGMGPPLAVLLHQIRRQREKA